MKRIMGLAALAIVICAAAASGQNPCENAFPDSCLYPDTCCVIPDSLCPWHWSGLDVVYMVGYFKGGPRPSIPSRCDANCNCHLNGIDITYLVRYFRGQGPAPLCCFYICPDR
jgi:hypothetical protein